jgi:hypothetical protein
VGAAVVNDRDREAAEAVVGALQDEGANAVASPGDVSSPKHPRRATGIQLGYAPACSPFDGAGALRRRSAQMRSKALTRGPSKRSDEG